MSNPKSAGVVEGPRAWTSIPKLLPSWCFFLLWVGGQAWLGHRPKDKNAQTFFWIPESESRRISCLNELKDMVAFLTSCLELGWGPSLWRVHGVLLEGPALPYRLSQFLDLASESLEAFWDLPRVEGPNFVRAFDLIEDLGTRAWCWLVLLCCLLCCLCRRVQGCDFGLLRAQGFAA